MRYEMINVLLNRVNACRECERYLPHGIRPVLQLSSQAKILIAGQAPGRKVHESGIPFNDASGERLRAWMGVDKAVFYDASQIATLPMGFCYPGTGKTGDLPPRKECAVKWRASLLAAMPNVQFVLVIGKYAQDYHLDSAICGKGATVTDIVAAWRSYLPTAMPLPHPSPRNHIWLKKNSWFESDVLPELKSRINDLLYRET
ncbi:MAG: uracil-DNA glycosylase family protein [Cellvibrionales bacterium]|nr:uracil-DNA glycosylase family protein [Cellvibrionales bacterium]